MMIPQLKYIQYHVGMHHTHSLPALCLLLACFSSVVTAAPAYTYTHGVLNRPPQRSSRPWRDWIIESIWPLPDSNVLSTGQPSRTGTPVNLRRPQYRYDNDIVLRFNITTPAEAASLVEASSILFLDVWECAEDWIDIRLAQDVIPSLLGLLPKSLRHAHTPLMQGRDLAQAVFDSRNAKISSKNDFFSEYRPLSVMVSWMYFMQALFETHVEVLSVGKSYEGRDITALRVGTRATNKTTDPRRTILIIGGLHAREWISTSTVNYVAYSLITSYGKSHVTTQLLEAFDFVFIPTVNPDGFAYTFEHDRLWRKNRQPTNLPFCRGIDLDRSFDFMWSGESSIQNGCSESYVGQQPFEAVEARRLAEWVQNSTESNRTRIVGFLDLHAYSQQILYPYSFSCDDYPPTLEDLEEMGHGLAKAIRTESKQQYRVVPACEGNVAIAASGGKRLLPRIKAGGGSALDWFYHRMGVRRTFQIKLRDKGSYGFLLPPKYIVPTGKEMVRAVKFFAQSLSDGMVTEAEDENDDFATSAGVFRSMVELEQPVTEHELVDDLYEWDLKK